MKITLLDIKTGKTIEVDDDICAFQWAENNWSDDCNRMGYFDDETQDDFLADCETQARKDNPEASENDIDHIMECTCWGANRFLVIAPETLKDETGSYNLREVNHLYDNELLDKHLFKVI